MFPPIAEVFAPEVAVELTCKDVIDHSVLGKTLGAGVFLGLEFGPKERCALAPVRAREGQKLPGHEVAGMRGHQIKEMGLLRRVAQGLERFHVRGEKSHKAKILAESSCSSRMRRRREASSRWL